MSLAPYNQIRENPLLLEQIENRLIPTMVRGGKYRPSPISIIKIPKKETLDDLMKERYGVERISDYFIPIVVDTNTYRLLTGEFDPDFRFDGFENYSRKKALLNGHVKKVDEYFISYISANLPLDEAIEHEGLHAYVLGHNKHYKSCVPKLGDRILIPPSSEDLSWIEAISWVATNEEVDKEKVFSSYVPTSGNNLFSKLSWIAKAVLASGIQTIGDIYRKHEEGNISDIHYVLSRGTMTAFQASIVFSRNQKKVTQVWEESFDLAQRLKQELGVKEFVKLSAKEHKNDLMKISPMV